jgi:hypothetical protein
VKTARLAILLLLAACSLTPPGNPAFVGTGDALLGASLQRALVAQSTLFPYHFRPASAELNDLGNRDLAVLAAHLAGTSGALCVPRGDATPELHEARVRAVMSALQAAGVPRERVALRDGLPGGDGARSTRIVEVLRRPLTLSGGGISGATPTVPSATSSGTQP